MREWADVFGKEKRRDGGEGEEREIILICNSLVERVRCVGRQKRLGGMKSWEVQLKANEAEQTLLRGKQFSMTGMAQAQAAVLLCGRAPGCLTRG